MLNHRKSSRRQIEGLGWIPDLPDQRDKVFMVPHAGPVPDTVDLQPGMPPVYDQGSLGSCTANAIAAAIEFDRLKQQLDDWVPSRLFIYYNERLMEGTVGSDAGGMIRDGIKSINQQGACKESTWPYDIGRFAAKPNDPAYAEGAAHRSVQYAYVPQDHGSLRASLAAGFPIVFGFSVYQSFMDATVATSGVVPMPNPGEAMVGGHAVVLSGYDDARGSYKVRNSWGPEWGQEGYFWIPFAYVERGDLSDDFWTVSLVQ